MSSIDIDMCLLDMGYPEGSCVCSRCEQQEEEDEQSSLVAGSNQQHQCTCDIDLLMRSGCECGAINKEKQDANKTN